jgi:hypothetical protein
MPGTSYSFFVVDPAHPPPCSSEGQDVTNRPQHQLPRDFLEKCGVFDEDESGCSSLGKIRGLNEGPSIFLLYYPKKSMTMKCLINKSSCHFFSSKKKP